MLRLKISKIRNRMFIKLLILLTFIVYISLMSMLHWKLETLEDLYEEVKKYNIFFIESNMKRAVISPKEMCAIESAARHNPKANVKVYTLRAQLNESARGLLTKYSNIEIIDFKPELVFKNESNMSEFWKKGDAMRSQYALAHLSDFIRFI